MHIVMIAAENGALWGGKVGGIGDVIRDVPLALAQAGHRCTVLTPGYLSLSQRNPSTLAGTVSTRFCGQEQRLDLFAVQPRDDLPVAIGEVQKGRRKRGKDSKAGAVSHYVLEHPLFAACGVGSIYCDDHHGPFATDAHKFALFCAAACQLLSEGRLGVVDVIHLHDWHAAMLAILRQAPVYQALRKVPLVFSIHNLSLQGIRPLSGQDSSLHHWFPELLPDLNAIQDPRYWDCVNLMRAGINLSNRVHAVSPSYAQEILVATDRAHGFIGGEGLEKDLRAVAGQGRLFGILNGCDYSLPPAAASSKEQLLELIEQSLLTWVADRQSIPAAHFYAQRRLAQWRRRENLGTLLTSVGRITQQKSRLFVESVRSVVHPGEDPEKLGVQVSVCSALEKLLDELQDGVFIMVGNGDEALEAFFTSIMAKRDNFLFLCGFSEQLADAIYATGDLFLMPSSYEPCGISQMLAMRAGTPCVVHHVGGLRDTVVHGENGFAFSGHTSREQAEHMLVTVAQARALMSNSNAWQKIRQGALDSRFSWTTTVAGYIDQLYKH